MNKTITLFGLISILSFNNLNAQDCSTNLDRFRENVKAKNYEEATSQLVELRKNCAKSSYEIYAFGERIYKAKLRTTTNKKEVVKELIQLHNDRLENFPHKTKKGDIYGDIGNLMVDYKVGTAKEQFDIFDKAFKEDEENFNNPKSIYLYFELYYNFYKKGTYSLTLKELIDKYRVLDNKYKELNGKLKSQSESLAIKKNKKKLIDLNLKAITLFSGKMNSLAENYLQVKN